MGSMKDLLGDEPANFGSYPSSPGYTNDTTSKAAAARIAPRAGTLRDKCLEAYRQDARSAGKAPGLTADECARAICQSILSVRPRVAELVEGRWLVDSGRRHPNESGASAIIWILSTEARP